MRSYTTLGQIMAFAGAMVAGALPAMLPAPASAQKIVMATWGGGVGATWRESYAKQFQEATGVPVTITEVPNPEAQVRAQAGSPQYNAIIGGFFDAVNLHRDGLIETFDPKDFPEIANVPERYRLTTPDGKLLGMPVYFAYYGIALNTDLAKPGSIKSWKDLTAAKWKGQLAITRPVYASTYDLTVLAYAAGGNESNIEPGLPLFEKIAANAMTVYSSMAQMNQLISRGEVAAAPYYSTRIWGMKREGQTNVDFVVPTEGALILPYIVAVPKGASDLATAKKWLDYAGGAAPQLRGMEMSGYLPFNEKAELTSEQEKRLGMGLAELKKKLIQPNWTVIAEKQRERANIVEQITAKVQ